MLLIKEKFGKNIKKIIFGLIGIFVIWQVIFNNDYWVHVWRDIKRDNVADIMVDMFAGCNARASIEEYSDEEFSQLWREKSVIYGFDYYDVKFETEHGCPIRDDSEIGKGYPFDKSWYEKERRMQDYKRKFLNREFTALQEDLKNGE